MARLVGVSQAVARPPVKFFDGGSVNTELTLIKRRGLLPFNINTMLDGTDTASFDFSAAPLAIGEQSENRTIVHLVGWVAAAARTVSSLLTNGVTATQSFHADHSGIPGLGVACFTTPLALGTSVAPSIVFSSGVGRVVITQLSVYGMNVTPVDTDNDDYQTGAGGTCSLALDMSEGGIGFVATVNGGATTTFTFNGCEEQVDQAFESSTWGVGIRAAAAQESQRAMSVVHSAANGVAIGVSFAQS